MKRIAKCIEIVTEVLHAFGVHNPPVLMPEVSQGGDPAAVKDVSRLHLGTDVTSDSGDDARHLLPAAWIIPEYGSSANQEETEDDLFSGNPFDFTQMGSHSPVIGRVKGDLDDAHLRIIGRCDHRIGPRRYLLRRRQPHFKGPAISLCQIFHTRS